MLAVDTMNFKQAGMLFYFIDSSGILIVYCSRLVLWLCIVVVSLCLTVLMMMLLLCDFYCRFLWIHSVFSIQYESVRV